MSGTYRGTIDCLLAESDEFNNAFVAYKHLYDLLAGHPGTTLIARHGDIPDYPDGANPPVAQDFAVFRFDTHAGRDHDFYVMIKVGGSGSAIAGVVINGNAPSSNNGQVFITAAIGVGGDTNPWQGTTNADGTDTHPTQLWDAPSAGTNVQVVPASNRDSGSDGTNKNNGIYAFDQNSPGDIRWSVVCDDDSIHIAFDDGDSGVFEYSSIGVLTPNVGIDWDTAPLYALYDSTASFSGNATTAYSEDIAGLAHPDGAEVTYSALPISVYGPELADTRFYPNSLSSDFDHFAPHVAAIATGNHGYAGQLPNVRATFNWPTNDNDTNIEFISLGASTTAQDKILFPWDGATTPQTSGRAGVSFTRTP